MVYDSLNKQNRIKPKCLLLDEKEAKYLKHM